jgi:tRNA A37 threonylcarbamoyladenosine dehydratase
MNFTDYKPEILSLKNETDFLRYQELQKQQGINRIDTMDKQLKEWVQIQHPDKLLTDEQINEITKEKLGNLSLTEYGNWVYYPWLNSLVHLLPENEFVSVRTNRNKLKITAKEQSQLAQKRIGIIGMSVGQAVAVTCAMERVAGEIRIADFDTLDLSNLNRLRAGVHNLGQNKAIIAARAIAEIDPYLKVTVYLDGISDSNIQNFFTDTGNLDALIEVCDGLDVKIKSRKMARSLNIPVIMDTNDRGMLDIERFDREPNRPLFHGLVPEAELELAHSLAPQQRVAMLMRLVSFENTSQRLKLSMNEIGKTIRTWPQLASSVQAGAGFTCETIRRILLKENVPSGRFYIDTEEIIKTA